MWVSNDKTDAEGSRTNLRTLCIPELRAFFPLTRYC